MLHLASVNVNKSQPEEILNRKYLENSPLSTSLQRGDDSIKIRCNSEFTLFTKRRLGPVADENEINRSVDHPFIDMYPIFPTIDLKDEHVYKHDFHTIGLQVNNNSLIDNVHTFFHIYDDKLSDEINTCRLIMFAFGHAHAKSKLLQQNKVFTLRFR